MALCLVLNSSGQCVGNSPGYGIKPCLSVTHNSFVSAADKATRALKFLGGNREIGDTVGQSQHDFAAGEEVLPYRLKV